MDLISQLQTKYAQLPAELKSLLEDDLHGTPLSVAEAHALSQLSQIGFVGIQNITTPVTPIGLHGELIPFLDASNVAIKSAQQFYTQFRLIDTLLHKLPNTMKQSDDEYENELNNLISELNQSCTDLFNAEEHLKLVQQDVRKVIQNGTTLLTQPFNNNQGILESIAVLPNANNLIPGLAPIRPGDVYIEDSDGIADFPPSGDANPQNEINVNDLIGIDILIADNDAIIVQDEPLNIDFDFTGI